MDKQEIAKMKRRVATLQRQMAELGPLMRGSVVIIGTRNKQSYFSLNKDGKTHRATLGKSAKLVSGNTLPTTKRCWTSSKK